MKKLWGLSIHNADVIHDASFEYAIDYMHKVKEKYNIQKNWHSIYEVEQLERLYQFWTPDIIQIPLNFFNNKFLKSGALEYIKSRGTILHARSLFCQGLLLQHKDNTQLEIKHTLKL